MSNKALQAYNISRLPGVIKAVRTGRAVYGPDSEMVKSREAILMNVLDCSRRAT